MKPHLEWRCEEPVVYDERRGDDDTDDDEAVGNRNGGRDSDDGSIMMEPVSSSECDDCDDCDDCEEGGEGASLFSRDARPLSDRTGEPGNHGLLVCLSAGANDDEQRRGAVPKTLASSPARAAASSSARTVSARCGKSVSASYASAMISAGRAMPL